MFLRKYTFVIVAHQVDYDVLCLQARSMAKYLPSSLTAEIIVVDNGITGSHDHLLRQYGRHQRRVRILSARSMAPSSAFNRSGWWSQQILKLLVSKYVHTARYVALDAKNVMMFPLHRSYLETLWGTPRSYHVDYTDHSSRRWLMNTLRYFNLSNDHIKKFMPVTTPFTMITDLVRKLIRHVEKRERRPFPEPFLERELTEFFLYAGYLLHTNRSPYSFTQQRCHTIFGTTSDPKFVIMALDSTQRNKLPFFSVHRRNNLSPECSNLIKRFRERRGVT